MKSLASYRMAPCQLGMIGDVSKIEFSAFYKAELKP